MYYVDSQRTVTRRESSLITKQFSVDSEVRAPSTARGPSTSRLTSESASSFTGRPRTSVRTEIVTLLFESMLDSIVDSWQTLEVKGMIEDRSMSKVLSDVTLTSKKKKVGARLSKTKKSRSRLDVGDSNQSDPLQQIWWSSPDEKAIIRFRNGNLYEGNISMKCMHGEGRFQWKDGTVYIGNFNFNEIKGKGRIYWKDDTWYEGDFVGNVRHGKGIYANSRKQSSYVGDWDNGTKHGKGIIYYDGTFKNNYDGDWVHNVRHGYGAREYCALSGYEGEWDRYVRHGKGLMIWPNHDYYQGGWSNGLMSGYGTYIWNVERNNTLALPVITVYRGDWVKGQREGEGAFNFGIGWGAHYKGVFKDNKKHGIGSVVTNSGLILTDVKLFHDDIMRPAHKKPGQESIVDEDGVLAPLQFDICDSNVGLSYHITKAYENLDRDKEAKALLVNEYIENNKYLETDLAPKMNIKEAVLIDTLYDQETLNFEEVALLNAVRTYQTDLTRIYYKYCQICNEEPVGFRPQLIRLFLWQFYWDCNIHQKGLTLVEIDNIFHANPAWLSKSPHNPFQKIFFWQFLHSVIAIASKLYAKKELPGPRPDTIVATAFRKFMDDDVLPGNGRRCGRLSHGFASYIPLKALYGLYLTLGEPHTVRKFVCAIRRSPSDSTHSSPVLVDGPEEVNLGRNVYIFGDQISFVMDETDPFQVMQMSENVEETTDDKPQEKKELILFNFSNLSTQAVIKIFANIFPQILDGERILTLDVEMTFLEFFEAFVACAEESIRIKEEEMVWRRKFEKAHAPTQTLSSPKSTQHY